MATRRGRGRAKAPVEVEVPAEEPSEPSVAEKLEALEIPEEKPEPVVLPPPVDTVPEFSVPIKESAPKITKILEDLAKARHQEAVENLANPPHERLIAEVAAARRRMEERRGGKT